MYNDNNCWIKVRTDGILRHFCLAWGWWSVLCFNMYLQVCVCVCVRVQFHFLLPWAKLYVLAGCESLPFHFQTFPHRCKLCQNFLARLESIGAYSMQITQPSSKSKCKEAVYQPRHNSQSYCPLSYPCHSLKGAESALSSPHTSFQIRMWAANLNTVSFQALGWILITMCNSSSLL